MDPTNAPQVFLGPMAPILADMLRVALRRRGVDLLGHRATAADLRTPAAGAHPPAGIVEHDPDGRFAHELLRLRPEALVVHLDGRGVSASCLALFPRRIALGELSADTVLASIAATPPWEERFPRGPTIDSNEGSV